MPKTNQPDHLRVEDEGYDPLEMVPLVDHVMLLQIDAEDGPQAVTIGPKQAAALLELLKGMV